MVQWTENDINVGSILLVVGGSHPKWYRNDTEYILFYYVDLTGGLRLPSDLSPVNTRTHTRLAAILSLVS